MDGMAAEKRRLCLSGESVNMQQFLKNSPELKIAFVIAMCFRLLSFLKMILDVM